MQECCGKCRFHKIVMLTNSEEWCCCNPESEYYGLETEYTDACEEYAKKKKGGSDD